MNEETVETLNRITRRFYDRSALGFAATHEAPRPGWRRVLDLLAPMPAQAPDFSVLDVGCGNGRFARFVHDSRRRPFRYLGLDGSPALVERARAELAGIEGARCERLDFVEESLDERLDGRAFTLVAAFGVLHHMPSHGRRRALLEQLCRRVAPGGALVCSVWRAQQPEQAGHEPLSADEYHRRTGERVEAAELEEGDHLVARARDAARYCHFVDDDEAARLIDGLPMDRVETFTADGSAGALNRYLLLRAPA